MPKTFNKKQRTSELSEEQKLEKLQGFYAEEVKKEQSHFLKTHRDAFRKKNKLKRMIRKRENKIAKDNGTFVPKIPLTIDAKRVRDISQEYHKNPANQEELIHAEVNDELERYFSEETTPKVAISIEQFKYQKVQPRTQELVDDLVAIFGGTFTFVQRGDLKVQSLREFCFNLYNSQYTSLFLIEETIRGPTHCLLIALPYGPSAFFRMYEVDLRKELQGAAKPLQLPPEVIMTNFVTRMGRRVGRLIQQQLSEKEELKAREVVTFHNERDNIFFRAYRYVFDEKKDADYKEKLEEKVNVRMQELGPRLSFKLRWVQKGVYDPEYEEYEFFENASVESENRALFYL